MKQILKKTFILMMTGLLFTFGLYGCGGDGDSAGIRASDNSGNDATSGGGSSQSDVNVENGPTVSFAAEIQAIFNEHCIECHFNGNLQGLPDLSEGHARQSLVNQDATLTDGGGKRVFPSDSANSVLYQRISGTGLPEGEKTMPFGDLLSLAQSKPALAAKIKTWIDEGAIDN